MNGDDGKLDGDIVQNYFYNRCGTMTISRNVHQMIHKLEYLLV